MQRSLSILLMPCLALAAAAPAASAGVPVGELRAGQTGYGLTVFQGSEPDTFGVTVLGVRHGARAGGDIILVELSGQGLETSAVAKGMSGSPVYLDDGRLVGAVAFGWPGALRPIAGLTPAADLELARTRSEVAAVRPPPASSAAAPATLLGQPARGELAARLLAGEGRAAPPPAGPAAGAPAAPWPTPEALAASLLPRADEPLATDLAPLPMGFYAVPTGTAATTAGAPALAPGAACAVALVSGDAQLGAIGTVSLVEGRRVVCMAHPFLQLGPVDLPLAAAEIVTLFPSRDMSFKLGSAGPLVGRVTHDLRAGLAGELGTVAPVTEVDVTVALPTGGDDYSFAVARHPALTPQLVYWCLYNALLAEGDDRSEQLVRYDVDLELVAADGAALPSVTLRGATGGPGGVAALSSDWQAPLELLLGNRHRPLDVAHVRARLSVERPAPVLTVRGLRAPARIAAGETFTVVVELEARHGGTVRERFELQAPASLPDGPLRLGVGSAREFFQFDAARASGLFGDHSLDAMLDLLNRPRSLDELVVALVSPRRSFTARGREFADLPGSVRATLAQGPPHAVESTSASYVARAARSLGVLVVGSAVQDITLRATRPNHAPGDRP